MPKTPTPRRIFFLVNASKPNATAALDRLTAFAASRARVVGTSQALSGREAVAAGADRVAVLGGDGTLIGVARSLAADQVPLIGVNVGKLGYLAEYSVEEFERCFDRAVADDSLISRRAVLEVRIHDGTTRDESAGSTREPEPRASALTTSQAEPRASAQAIPGASKDAATRGAVSGPRVTGRDVSPAINDCVIQAGPPFRMITLGLSVNGQRLTDVAGDGLIVCTPTGSTAHNLSAGGPILHAEVDAIVMTPLCPHSLTHRPLVVRGDAVIEITARQVNEGTTVILDGQASSPLRRGQCVTLRRSPRDFLLVRNPLYPPWHNLMAKLHWGQSPGNDEPGPG